MLAVDTNVIVRLLTRDDPAQYGRAYALFGGNGIWVPVTVVLEVEWVLRRAFRLAPRQIGMALRALIGLSGVQLEQAAAVMRALDWFDQGMDFADALHLAAARDCDGLATFDREFIQVAARVGPGNVAEP